MRKVLIIGAGVAGRDVYKEIKRSPSLRLEVAGFIDDDKEKQGKAIGKTKVLGSIRDIRRIIKEYKIEEAIIAIPSAEGERILAYIKQCSSCKVAFRIVPRVKEIIEGKAHVAGLRKPNIEDLLGRPIVHADVSGLKNFLKYETVLIAGAAGSIGSELSRQVAAYGSKNLILLDWWENGLFELQNNINELFPRSNKRFVIGNIQDRHKIRYIFEKYRPSLVLHTAAYKHVPAMEDNPEEAVKNNIFGTLVMAEEARRSGVRKFIVVSSDKAARPRNIMGATKLVTEAIGKKMNSKKRTRFMAVRFGNVLGSQGSVVPIFQRQIESGGPVKITDKRMTRYFMTIPEAAHLILKAASFGEGGELFVLDMGSPVQIVTLAENMIRLHGLRPYVDIKIVFTGKRHGEKIHERLFARSEELQRTTEGKIFITETRGIDVNKLSSTFKALRKETVNSNSAGIRRILKRIIPTLPSHES